MTISSFYCCSSNCHLVWLLSMIAFNQIIPGSFTQLSWGRTLVREICFSNYQLLLANLLVNFPWCFAPRIRWQVFCGVVLLNQPPSSAVLPSRRLVVEKLEKILISWLKHHSAYVLRWMNETDSGFFRKKVKERQNNILCGVTLTSPFQMLGWRDWDFFKIIKWS